MPVYVDNMRAPFGRMTMCHMVADSDDELHAMANAIGVARRWHQKPGTPQSHYDICTSKRTAAVAAGAIEVDLRFVAMLVRRKRVACAETQRVQRPIADAEGVMVDS